jgi:archaellum component FlaF (FlaF/FlaG flagellin family)
MIVDYISDLDANSTLYSNAIVRHELPCIVLDFCRSCVLQSLDVKSLLIEKYSKFQKNPPLLVIHSIGESPTIDHFGFLKALKLLHPDLKILHITTGWESPQADYTTITDCSTFFWPMQSLWKDSFSHQATHHFVALARTPRYSRTQVVNSILNRNLQQWGYFSIGSGNEYNRNNNFFLVNQQELGIDSKNLPYFPCFIDGEIVQQLEVVNGQFYGKSYEITNDKIKNALVNVVLESGFEYSSAVPGDWPWAVPMLTEKTVKAFALGQIPMILGPRGQVEKTRQQGFDLFDDLIDHGYDNEPDPFLRIEQFVNSLEKFIDRVPSNTLQGLKELLMLRFMSNQELAKKMSNYSIDVEVKKFLDSVLLENL